MATNTELVEVKKNITRVVLPNDFEFEKKETINNKAINVSLKNVKEAVRIRVFTKQEATAIIQLKDKERSDFVSFCKRYPNFEGVFYSQLNKSTKTDSKSLEALDYIQDIKETNKRPFVLIELFSVVFLNYFRGGLFPSYFNIRLISDRFDISIMTFNPTSTIDWMPPFYFSMCGCSCKP